MLIEVVEYRSDWPEEFAKEASKLRLLLGDTIIKLHHIGSTAVPGLMAKPIIDMLMEVRNLDDLDRKNDQLESLGYEVMGELGIPRRRYFRKGGDHRTHQIHAFKTGDPHLKRHLAFRDYLRAHPEVAEEYGQLKSEIAARCHHDIEKYGDEKDPFIKLHERKALVWYEEES